VDLPSDNYSEALSYARNNSKEFPKQNQLNDMSWDDKIKSYNYNCYHFSINGAWEKDIYSIWSYGSYMMEPESFQSVLNNYFTQVSPDQMIYGESIITMNYSGGYPMHSAIFGGTDKEGNIYIIEKYGGHEAPNIRKLSDTGYYDFKFFNEKGAIQE